MISFKKIFLSSIISLFSISYMSNVSLAKDNNNNGVSKYILDPMPSWYNERYYSPHLDISLMEKDGYSRYEALEIQNQMKDILETNKDFTDSEEFGGTKDYRTKNIIDALNKAVKIVTIDKKFESGFTPEKNLKNNEFYVVFDLDETLLVQWYEMGEKGSKYYDGKVSNDCLDNIIKPKIEGPNYFSLIPKLEETFKRISKIPGNKGILLFSAKLDSATYCILDKIKIDGKPILNYVKGTFTRNYLIRDTEPTKLAKDLRIIDESLDHVILIDDNPTRILESQKRNLRKITKYNPDVYLKAKDENNKKITNYFENVLNVIVNEIEDSADYSRKNNINFVDAYFPYTDDASDELLTLEGQGMNLKQSIDFIRKNRDIFDTKFYVPSPKNNN